jgi:hypothetical protein
MNVYRRVVSLRNGIVAEGEPVECVTVERPGGPRIPAHLVDLSLTPGVRTFGVVSAEDLLSTAPSKTPFMKGLGKNLL